MRIPNFTHQNASMHTYYYSSFASCESTFFYYIFYTTIYDLVNTQDPPKAA